MAVLILCAWVNAGDAMPLVRDAGGVIDANGANDAEVVTYRTTLTCPDTSTSAEHSTQC